VLTYERVHDEHGREMHKSLGNAIEANEAFEHMGADIVRWQYCAQNPSQNINFGYGPAEEVKRRLLTLWNSVGFLVTYANTESWEPKPGTEPRREHALDRWLAARTAQLVDEAHDAYERYATPAVTTAFEAYVEDLSNWYIRRSRRRFWEGDAAALETLWWSLVQALRVVAPVMPFLADHLWRVLTEPAEGAPDSVFLAGWPEARLVDEDLLAQISDVRRVVELGRQARSAAGVKLRQPLRALVVEGAVRAEGHADEIAEELRVKQVSFGRVDASELRVRPNLPVLGPKLGKELGAVRAALEAGDFEELSGGGFSAAGHVLGRDEVLVERRGKEGFAVASADSVTVALDTQLDDELLREGRVYDLIHEVNTLRKEAGLELTDRIRLALPEGSADLLTHSDWIARETLAISAEADGTPVRIERIT
jgi:isoleucyl-tRNA synthetase